MQHEWNAEALVLDGNAVAGDLESLFGFDLTALQHACRHCGNRGALGGLRAYARGPGSVLRCVMCGEVVVRLAVTPRGTFLDLSGAAYVRVSEVAR